MDKNPQNFAKSLKTFQLFFPKAPYRNNTAEYFITTFHKKGGFCGKSLELGLSPGNFFLSDPQFTFQIELLPGILFLALGKPPWRMEFNLFSTFLKILLGPPSLLYYLLTLKGTRGLLKLLRALT